MMPELFPPYAALARTRATSCQPDPSAAEAREGPGCFADEMSEPAAAEAEDGAEDDRRDDKVKGSPPVPTALFGPTPVAISAPAANGMPEPALVAVPDAVEGGGRPALPAAALAGGEVGLIRDGPTLAGTRADLSAVAASVSAPVAQTGVPGAATGGRAEAGAGTSSDTAEADAASPAETAALTADAAGEAPPAAVSRSAPGPVVATGMAQISAAHARGGAMRDSEEDQAASPRQQASAEEASGAGPRAAAGPAGAAPGDPRTAPAAGADTSGSGTGPDGGAFADRPGADTVGVASLSGTGRPGSAPADALRTDHRSAAPQTIGSQIIDGIRQTRDGSVEIALNPEELGSLRLTIAGDESNLHVRIHADRPETEGLLRRHIALLQQDFRDLGYGQVAFDFGPRQDPPARFAPRPEGDAGPAAGIEPGPAATDAPPRPIGPLAAGRGLDLRL